MKSVTYTTNQLDRPTEIDLTDIILVSSLSQADRNNFDILPFDDTDWDSIMSKGYYCATAYDLQFHHTELEGWFEYLQKSYGKVIIPFTSYDILKTAVDMYDEGRIKSLSLIRIGGSVLNSTKGKKTLTQFCNDSLSTAFHSGIELR